MAHFVELDENNIVLRVIVVDNNELLDSNGVEVEQKGIDFCTKLLGGKWLQTSFNNNFRARYAQTGMLYQEDLDVFVYPQPHPWYVLNNDFEWECPTGLDPNTGLELTDIQWEYLELLSSANFRNHW